MYDLFLAERRRLEREAPKRKLAAAGRPTIFIGARDGEIGRILAENDCGFTVTPGDGER